MSHEQDVEFLDQAIQNSSRSYEQGNFPAGSILVKDGQILASEVSSPYPGLFHADSKAVNTAFNKVGPLSGATLYVGLEPCLMCTGVIYWGGVRRVVFAVPKNSVSSDYYETATDTRPIKDSFNEKIEFVHIPELQEKALEIVRMWERNLK